MTESAGRDTPEASARRQQSGPFRVRSWDQSSVAVLEANPDYVLGRPKLDVIEARFIPDGNTLTATILAGAIDPGACGERFTGHWFQGVMSHQLRFLSRGG